MCGPCKRIRFSKPDLRDRLADSTKERWYNSIVLNIPHASVGGLGIARWDDKVALLSEVKRWTDWFTDLLFIPDNREGIQFITSDYSRFVVDVERLVNDPLEKIGQGIVYKMHNGLHRTFKGNEEIEMFRYHVKYIRDLRLMLNEHSLLIDCHSFPSDLSEVDICIGYNDDWSRPTDFVIELCKSVFEKHGYQVGINTPYANAIAPETGYAYNSIIDSDREYINRHWIELMRKFTLSVACLLLFLIGAPFGSIVRKGGLGMPLVASVIFFVLYYVIGMISEKSVRESAVGPVGMWVSTFVFIPIGALLTWQATTDSSLFDLATWKRWLRIKNRHKHKPDSQ